MWLHSALRIQHNTSSNTTSVQTILSTASSSAADLPTLTKIISSVILSMFF